MANIKTRSNIIRILNNTPEGHQRLDAAKYIPGDIVEQSEKRWYADAMNTEKQKRDLYCGKEKETYRGSIQHKNIKNLFDFYSEKKITAFLIFLVTITFLFFLDYNMNYGGGIIYQLFFKSETIYLFYFISYLSLLFIG